jgi:hypothetical protein
MGNVLTAHMKGVGDDPDSYWNNNTILGETIEKALLKNTPAQQQLERELGYLDPTRENTTLIKRACCLGIPYEGKKLEENMPIIKVPIANVGLQVGIPVATRDDGKLLYPDDSSNLGLPNKNGKFKHIDDSATLFNNLREKDKKYNLYPVKPRNNDWYKTEPLNDDHQKTFNSGGMIIKKLRFKDNNGKKLIKESQCSQKKEKWETVDETGIRKYESYNHTGGPGKTYDESVTTVCDSFYKYYGQHTIWERGCIIEDEDNDVADVIDYNQPGCGTTIQVPDLQPPQIETFVEWFEDTNSGEASDENNIIPEIKSEKYFYNDKGVSYTPQFHYPNDLACVNSPYGSVYTDTGTRRKGTHQNPYSAGSVFTVTPSLANPIGIDRRCKGNINNPVSWGEAYTTTDYRKEGNSVKCVATVVMNNIKADTVEVSDIEQTNDCDAITTQKDKDDIDNEGKEVDPSTSDVAESVSGVIEEKEKKLKEEADNVQKETANATKTPSENLDIEQLFKKHKLAAIATGGCLCLMCLILLLFLMKK